MLEAESERSNPASVVEPAHNEWGEMLDGSRPDRIKTSFMKDERAALVMGAQDLKENSGK